MEKGLVSVDRWAKGSQAYFLTHLHADHTQGLRSSWSNSNLPIFCSHLTAKLLPVIIPNFNVSFLRVLDLGSWRTLSLTSPSTGSEVTLHVMAIDAHHCPGAVMFLFRGDFGYVLNTGDFRWEKEDDRTKSAKEMLLNALKDDVVDQLHLDNTFCNPSFQFPPRGIAAQQVVDIITAHPKHDVIIAIDNLGKEELLLHISNALNTKIWVSPERLQIMHILGFHDTFTSKTSLTRVRAVPRYSFRVDTLEILNATIRRPTIGIIPSGLPWVVKPIERDDKIFYSLSISDCNGGKVSSKGGELNDISKGNSGSVKRLHKYIYSVQYSSHSCYGEIEEFIKLVRPTSAKGMVPASFCCVDPLCYFGQSSQRLHHHQYQKEGRDRVAHVHTNGSCCYTEVGKRRKRLVGRLGFSVSKVTILRRGQRGVKLAENECSD